MSRFPTRDEQLAAAAAIDAYGSAEHEAWLIEMEREDERWAGQPDVPTRSEVGGCGCVVSQVYGGDCEHTVEGPEDFLVDE